MTVDGCHYDNTRNGRRDTECPLARHFPTVWTDLGASGEGAICAWIMNSDEVDGTRALQMMRRRSLLLVWQGSPEPGLRVRNHCLIHWSQHLLTLYCIVNHLHVFQKRTYSLSFVTVRLFLLGAPICMAMSVYTYINQYSFII